MEDDIFAVVGIPQLLWWWTADFALAGDIGRFSDRQIACALHFPTKPLEEIVQLLINSRWIYKSEKHRVIVCDWPKIAGDSVHRKLARERKLFADGTRPNTERLQPKERREIEAYWEERERTICAQNAHAS